jgi:hypothetical protein
MKFCSYGCGKEGKYELLNKKSCCSPSHTKCPSFQSKVTYAFKTNTNSLCDYNCGQKANYIFKASKKFCCSERLQSCPEVRRRNSEKNKVKQAGSNNAMFGKKHSKKSIEKIGNLIKHYGMIQIAFLILKSGEKDWEEV